MFVELLEKLRCPNEHEPSALIATASRTVDRHIIEGTLGCPVCHAEFAIRNGVLDLGGARRTPTPADGTLPDERMTRTGALLGLDERGGIYVLDSITARVAAGLRDLSPNSRFIALSGDGETEGASGAITGPGDAIPLADACARGIVLDEATPGLLRSAVRVLAPGGRLVAPAGAPTPNGVTELARDERQWVAERDAGPALAELRRAR